MAKKLALRLLYTFLSSSFVAVVLLFILNPNVTGSLEGNQAMGLMVIFNLALALFLTLVSLPVFFYLNINVQKNIFLKFLSFYGLLLLSVLIIRISGDKHSEWDTFYTTTAVYIVTYTLIFNKILLGRK
jgi:hypothetical protein